MEAYVGLYIYIYVFISIQLTELLQNPWCGLVRKLQATDGVSSFNAIAKLNVTKNVPSWVPESLQSLGTSLKTFMFETSLRFYGAVATGNSILKNLLIQNI